MHDQTNLQLFLQKRKKKIQIITIVFYVNTIDTILLKKNNTLLQYIFSSTFEAAKLYFISVQNLQHLRQHLISPLTHGVSFQWLMKVKPRWKTNVCDTLHVLSEPYQLYIVELGLAYIHVYNPTLKYFIKIYLAFQKHEKTVMQYNPWLVLYTFFLFIFFLASRHYGTWISKDKILVVLGCSQHGAPQCPD